MGFPDVEGKDEILVDGAVEAVLLAFTVQIKPKHEKLRLGRTHCRRGLRRLHWIIACVIARRKRFAAGNIPFSKQDDEENFDLSLIASLEKDVTPISAVIASPTISSPIWLRSYSRATARGSTVRSK